MNGCRKRVALIAGSSLLAVFVLSPIVLSHCEIPCGIYDDPVRINMMYEHVQTIEKSMNQIHELSGDRDKDHNQLVRWIINKENHADKLSDIVTQYFMKQRIKLPEKTDGKAYREYVKKLTLLHKLMVYSMKCKQTTNLDHVPTLRKTITEFKMAYMGEGRPAMSTHEHTH
jgi:nickel superoxide dismutase